MKKISLYLPVLLLFLAAPALAEWMIPFNLKSRYLHKP